MDDQVSRRYEPHVVEARRQAAWRERDAFRTPAPSEDRPHIYVKPSAPFTSGNIHIGHVRSYSIGDAYARFRRARGDGVLFAFGFDAFGLPAELGAIAGGISPSEWVNGCAEHMTGQLQRLGFSFDWERSFMSSDALMYRWSQWLFLTLYEAGLIYRGTGNVDWCESCQTTLATIQVEQGGTCWRCHGPVRLIELPQWYLRISAYLEENDARLAELQGSGIWDEVALASQVFVMGRVDGVEVELPTPGGGALLLFTSHPGGAARARFVALSPRHPDADRWAEQGGVLGELEQLRSGGWERSAREAETIPLVQTGISLPSPAGDGSELPVVITPFVDGRFGPTAMLGVPALDRAEETIARRLGLSMEEDADGAEGGEQGEAEPGAMGGPGAGAGPDAAVGELGRPAHRYKAFDFTISRQRSWGTPIPIVYCENCGTVPVPREQLPVVLPLELRPTGAGSPLAEHEEFVHTSCPSCGGPARRETDTLDCHFDALWLWIPACVPQECREDSLEEILALADLRCWLPSERLVAGSDSGNFVFDQRTVTKALRDIGPLAFLADGEPFAGCLFHEMVIRDGRKMSKHLGNVVDPDELVERYGADTVRLAVLYAARPQRSLNWDDSAVLRCHRFLAQVWDFATAHLAQTGEEVEKDTSEHLRVRLAKWTETGVEKITQDMQELEMHTAVRNVMRLFDRMKDFEKRARSREDGRLSEANRQAALDALGTLLQLLGPFVPHMAEELWLALGNEESLTQMPWPGVSFEEIAA